MHILNHKWIIYEGDDRDEERIKREGERERRDEPRGFSGCTHTQLSNAVSPPGMDGVAPKTDDTFEEIDTALNSFFYLSTTKKPFNTRQSRQ